ncbi:PH domain-containing protein [Actinoplanes sp. NEAU-A12]|uniref:PH domain-containing protein n=1 Tax=Actinoplanes sandaracinus TaxID=3045177 RepID=A0ABT6X192_9ACTN|nr:PH domain-containing protein [Actinoplanes sandaracinus]MDI6105727.1 PH domain-containing protein [Actinoplanes sandaracinus]
MNARLILVNLGVLAAPVALLLTSLLVTGGRLNLQALIILASLLLIFLVVCGISLMRYFTTRYRITQERIELHSGLLFRSRRSIPVGRVRSVDLIANPMHRVFGLTTLRIDTGEQSSAAGRLRLDGIARADAEALRRRIVERRDATGTGTAGDDVISQLDWRWLRYAPLTVWGVGSVFAGFGTAYRILHEMKVDPLQLGIVKAIIDRFGAVPLWFGLLTATVIVLALGVLCSTAGYIESWSGYQLRRQDDRIESRRGLLVTRAVGIQRQRLRGVELVEPMPLRWADAAKLNAVATGLGSVEDNRRRRALTPPVPREEALRVATEIIGQDSSLIARRGLTAHPRLALWRRINRGLTTVALIAAVPVGLGLWLSPTLVRIGWISALALAPIAVLLAYDAYRTLGHRIRDRYLVISSGLFARRAVALERQAIMGWSVSRSFLQRRSGLITLGAITAAGEGMYKIRDVSQSHGLATAEEAMPGILTPFIERVPPRS